METPTAPPPMMLDRSQPCVKCSYDLRGLPLDGVCPECGAPVQDSLRGILFAFASPDYRGKIAKGLSLVLTAILLTIVLGVGSLVVSFAMGGAPSGRMAVAVASLGVTAMGILGYWWYTEPDPGYTGLERPNSARQVARIAVMVQAGVQAVQLVMMLMSDTVGAATGTAAGFSAVMILSGFLSLLALAAWVTQFFAVMQYTRWMATRIPDAFIQRRAATYMWLLPVISVVGAILLFLGPLVALILYWNLLDRLRKHVKSINTAGRPARLDGMAG
ncbi:MAG: hypothetical protein QM783_02635 [Phycisphaerales bacterium]